MGSKSELVKLRQKWYRKLKESGFEDIEVAPKWEGGYYRDMLKGGRGGSAYFLARFGFFEDGDPTRVRGDAIQAYERREDYYRNARALLFEIKFKNKQEKNIWELHSEAVSYREISRRLKLPDKWWVEKCVAKYRKILLVRLVDLERGKDNAETPPSSSKPIPGPIKEEIQEACSYAA